MSSRHDHPHDAENAAHRCPTCAAPVRVGAEDYPFCGQRCRMADLGRWLRGDYVISRPLTPEDAEDPPPPQAGV